MGQKAGRAVARVGLKGAALRAAWGLALRAVVGLGASPLPRVPWKLVGPHERSEPQEGGGATEPDAAPVLALSSAAAYSQGAVSKAFVNVEETITRSPTRSSWMSCDRPVASTTPKRPADVVVHQVDGVSIPFASPRLLWRMKIVTHREKDAADLVFLRHWFSQHGEEPPPA